MKNLVAEEERVDTTSGIAAGLLLVLALVLVNAFFVAGEYALVRVRRTRMEALAGQGSGPARAVVHGLDHLGRYVAGAQVGITLAGLASGRFGEPALARVLEPLFGAVLPAVLVGPAAARTIATALTLMLITYLLVVVGELVPKSLTLSHPERAALVLARPMRLCVLLFTPVVWSMNGLGRAVLRLLRLPPADEAGQAPSVDELKLLIVQSHKAGILEDIERRLTQRTFQFADLRAADVMIPRPDMVALDVSVPADELCDRVARSIHTRFPVYEGTTDHIIGTLHLQDLFRRLRTPGALLDVRGLLRPALLVPETLRMEDLLDQLRRHRTQIAVVVDEHGGTAGLVTLEDIVEEVFGELHDALEAEQPDVATADDGRTLIRGDVRLARLHELGVRLDDSEADTIAGYVMERLGRVARVGDVVETPSGAIRVENMARLRITQVSLRPADAGSAQPQEGGPR
jgi:CBS domain containing-hemolysin-like protein